MDGLLFSWDEGRIIIGNRSNQEKHGVSFEEAESVFSDEYARLISDPDHSLSKDRFILLGLSSNLRLVLVCHCYRKKEEIIRIISARKANRKEHKQYREMRHER